MTRDQAIKLLERLRMRTKQRGAMFARDHDDT